MYPAWLSSEICRPATAGATGKDMLRARFCLCPTGYGWGIRFTQAMHTGCVPVIVQVRTRNGRQGVHTTRAAHEQHARRTPCLVLTALPLHIL